ncbi:hypothetical protein CPB84DRAFT_241081 [Gymnopilus junonius]|uniref:Uncharacterized protein n=1 Tax=Gymnopilus junonius TaxID=109634 RepID=A0A9P5NSS3_GYMJU|nr:hypothetical protein CPB84DRAFT_241081 [Gymnopilus junonius]
MNWNATFSSSQLEHSIRNSQAFHHLEIRTGMGRSSDIRDCHPRSPSLKNRSLPQYLPISPSYFFAKRVKRLYITTVVPFPQARAIVAACTNATDVSCWADRSRTAKI